MNTETPSAKIPQFYSMGDETWTASDGTQYKGLLGNFNIVEWASPPENLPTPVYPSYPDEGFPDSEEGRARQQAYEANCAACVDIERRINGVQLDSAEMATGHLREAIDAGFEVLRLNLRPGIHHVRRTAAE